MSRFAVYTQAHNAEKTLRNTIESVLNQTEGDFVYYIADNVSDDSTREIIREYALLDRRVRPILYDRDGEQAVLFRHFCFSVEVIRTAAVFDWFCTLDADDIYASSFLSEMQAFAESNCLDLAVCGTQFVDAETHKRRFDRIAQRDMILTGDGFGKYLPFYHVFMRPHWAKLYSQKCLSQIDLSRPLRNLSVGNDTMLVFEAMRHCERVGVLSKILHYYTYSDKSTSYKLDSNRVGADEIQHNDTVQFLKEKVGRVSSENKLVLNVVYLNAIKDTLCVIYQAGDISVDEKLSSMRQLFESQVTLSAVLSRALEETHSREFYNSLLDALDYWGVLSEDSVWLGLTLSSITNNQAAFVHWSKNKIRQLIKSGRNEEAASELLEWENILAGDRELAELRSAMYENKETIPDTRKE